MGHHYRKGAFSFLVVHLDCWLAQEEVAYGSGVGDRASAVVVVMVVVLEGRALAKLDWDPREW